MKVSKKCHRVFTPGTMSWFASKKKPRYRLAVLLAQSSPEVRNAEFEAEMHAWEQMKPVGREIL